MATTTFGTGVRSARPASLVGTGPVIATNPVAITNTLSMVNSFTASVAGGSLAVSGSNLANAATPNNLTLSGGTVTVTTPFVGINGNAVNVFLGGASEAKTNTGTGPSPDTGTAWNTPVYGTTAPVTTLGLKYSNSGASIRVLHGRRCN